MSKSQKGSIKGKRPLQVLFLPVDDGGCGWQRIRLFNDEFQNRSDVKSYLMDGKEDSNKQVEMITSADVVVGRLGDYQYFKIIKEDIDPSKPMVFDHDDNTMEVLPTSEHYREFGTEDAWVKKDNKLIPVWVTGITNGFNRYKNLSGQMNLLYILAVADMITSPVPNLLEYYLQFGNKNVRGEVVHNCLNFDLFPEGEFIPKDKKNGEIRLGWEGGVSHMGDWQEIKEPLERVMKKYPEVTLYIHGSYYESQFREFKDRIIRGAWFPYRGYTFKIKTMGLDGAIIPLESKSFNEYKSELKFTEFSGMNIPCVIKDMLPYSRVVRDGENCWAYKTPEEFEQKLTEMIEDIKNGREKCNKYVTAAKEWVKEERDIKKEAGRLVEIYKSLLPEDVQMELI
ncbi:MAG: glycosyltransferase [Candidatus Methanofastidiosa archaeon]|nr:glycosyltransferase [Candidatus Methanofastidiosa archaeon]